MKITTSLMLGWSKFNLLAAGLIATALLMAPRALAEAKPGSWPEFKAYHAVMSATFHPAEKGNLEPIKTRSGELARAAKTWMESKAPVEFNTPAIKESLKKLQEESAALDQLIIAKQATDAEVKATLVKLHDRFHELASACTDPGKDATP